MHPLTCWCVTAPDSWQHALLGVEDVLFLVSDDNNEFRLAKSSSQAGDGEASLCQSRPSLLNQRPREPGPEVNSPAVRQNILWSYCGRVNYQVRFLWNADELENALFYEQGCNAQHGWQRADFYFVISYKNSFKYSYTHTDSKVAISSRTWSPRRGHMNGNILKESSLQRLPRHANKILWEESYIIRPS